MSWYDVVPALILLVMAIVWMVTFAVGIQEASDPNHSKRENLSGLEEQLVEDHRE